MKIATRILLIGIAFLLGGCLTTNPPATPLPPTPEIGDPPTQPPPTQPPPDPTPGSIEEPAYPAPPTPTAMTMEGAYPAPNQQSSAPKMISWEDVVNLIQNGQVTKVSQYRDLTVELILRDGSLVQATEPQFDDVMRVLDECGEPCATIERTTE